MTDLYSRPLSPEARSELVDFIQAYIETLAVAEVDEKAEAAKAKAIKTLNTDIDILAFVTTLMVLYQPISLSLVNRVVNQSLDSRKAAELIVEIAEKARQIDRSSRPGG